jgi:hypothetical protein
MKYLQLFVYAASQLSPPFPDRMMRISMTKINFRFLICFNPYEKEPNHE